MSVKQNVEGEVAYLEGDSNTQTVEIFNENEFSEKRKIKWSLNKKQKNEHRKAKKRKYKEISNNSDSSDDNLLNIKTKQDMVTNAKKFKKSKKKKKKGRKDNSNTNNACGDIYIKQEILSENDQNVSDESDEDVPLSYLEKDTSKSTNGKLKVRKTYQISNNSNVPDVEGKVKKLRIKKIKIEKDDCVISCADCGKSFDDNLKYKAHMRKVHSYKSHVCGICTKAFYRERDLENHYNTHTGQNPYCCGQCGKLFKSDGTLKKHIRIYHADNYKKYACTMCPKVLSSASCLEEHERLHTGENPWSCNLCGKLFARERDLKLHANLHEELWKCDICQKCFLTSFKLKEHYRSHTGETPYECDKCDRKFARIADYRYHMGTHLGLKPFTCELCGMKFTTSSSMKRHLINMHQQGPLDFKCHICTKGFHSQARLNSHIKNHEYKKKYVCHLCNATRSSHAELQRHLTLHSGEFRCDTCNQSCSSAQRLAAHVAKHDLTGKPYACFVCSLGYQSSHTLNKHLATVHKNEDLPKVAPQHLCTLCGMVFDHKDKLNRHLKDDHVVLAVGEILSLTEEEPYSIGKQQIPELSQTTERDATTQDDGSAGQCSKKEFKIKILSPTKLLDTNKSEIPSHADRQKCRVVDIEHAEQNCDKNNDSINCVVVESRDDSKDNPVNLMPDNLDAQDGSPVISEQQIKSNECKIKTNLGNKPCIDVPKTSDYILQDKHAPCIKSEKNSPKSENYSSSQSVANQNNHQNSTQLVENLARKNIESFLQKQDLGDINYSVSDKDIDDIKTKKVEHETEFDRRKKNPSSIEDINKDFPQLPNSNIKQDVVSESSQLRACNERSDTHEEDINTKKEVDSSLIEQVQAVERDSSKAQQKNHITKSSSGLSFTNVSSAINYFDDFGVKDLSTSSDKGLHNTCDSLYSKTAYTGSPVSQHSKAISQVKNVTDSFQTYSHTQPGAQHITNPWFLPSKISSANYQESVLKQHNTSGGYADSKQKDTKFGHLEMFPTQPSDYEQHFNNQNKIQVDSRQDISLFSGSPALNKNNYYDKKHSYGTSTSAMDPKHYFDDFNPKAFNYVEDDRKRAAHLHNNVTNSKQNARSYQTLQNHLSSEPTIPSPLTIPDHFNPPDQFNYYNPHAFATMANSPHLFQNFRELQHRMLSSGIPSYHHHSRQHMSSGIDVTSQRMMSNSPSSGSSLYNQPHFNSMPSITRHAYNDVSNPRDSTHTYQNNRPSPDNGDGGQGKDDSNSPYELRVAAN